MNARPVSHPTDQTLRSYGLGKLDDGLGRGRQPASGAVPGLSEASRRAAGRQLPRTGPRRQGAGKSTCSANLPSGIYEPDERPSTPAPPPASTLPPGLAEHPDYEILRELGRGGMGVVYLAQNKLMGRKEVLKVVSGSSSQRPACSTASSARSGRPPSCTTPTSSRRTRPSGWARASSSPWSTSRATTWPSSSRQGPLQVAHACNFIHQAALGFSTPTRRGMVHRDIKPSNLMLAREGKKPVVKVLDFGLAKVTSEGQGDSGLTREGQMLGTPDYIAPEQIRDAQSGRHPRRHLQPGLHALLPPGGPPAIRR